MTRISRFYWHVFDALEPGGLFFTSATAYERKSDFLMKAFEMESALPRPRTRSRRSSARCRGVSWISSWIPLVCRPL